MRDRTLAIATFVLVLAVMLAAMAFTLWRVERASIATDPHAGYELQALVDAGLKVDTRIDAGEVGRLVSAGLVHTSRVHLVVNALGLLMTALFWWRLNPALRGPRHTWILPAIVVVASTGGFFVSYLVRAGPSGGASAAVYGVLAAVAGATWARRRELPERARFVAPFVLTLLSLGAVVIVVGKPGMDHAAHLGGWAVGLATGFAARHPRGRAVLGGLAALCIVVALTF